VPEARQQGRLVEQLDPDQRAIARQAQLLDRVEPIQGQLLVRLRRVGERALRRVVRIDEEQLAPNACAERIRLPRFMGLLMPSAPMPK